MLLRKIASFAKSLEVIRRKSYAQDEKSAFSGAEPGTGVRHCGRLRRLLRQQREQQKEQPEKQEEKEQQKEYEGKAVYNIIKQPSNMKEADKESFLSLFVENEKTDIAGFCVLGGIFSEGIDLRGDALIGVAVVGTGIPMVCRQRNILRDYFDSHGKNGYQYAYVYPGMNKVLQAAGRVIRTDNDKGIILLLDDRFLTKEYELQYPREWDKIYPCDAGCVSEYIDDFWKGITADD